MGLKFSGSGIYLLRNAVTGDTYVGCATALADRIRQHVNGIRERNHPQMRIRRSFEGLGLNALEIEVLEHIDLPTDPNSAVAGLVFGDEAKKLLISRERHWIDTLRPNLNAECSTGTSDELKLAELVSIEADRGDLLVSVPTLARLIDASDGYIYMLLRTHRLPTPIKIGCRCFWRRKEIESWIDGGCRPVSEWKAREAVRDLRVRLSKLSKSNPPNKSRPRMSPLSPNALLRR